VKAAIARLESGVSYELMTAYLTLDLRASKDVSRMLYRQHLQAYRSVSPSPVPNIRLLVSRGKNAYSYQYLKIPIPGSKARKLRPQEVS
jgi:hypothetical protein